MVRIFGAILAFVVGRLLAVRRTHVVAALETAGVSAPDRIADRMYRSLGMGMGELFGLTVAPRSSLDRIDLSHIERRWLESDRGVVILTAHTGNWDLLACAATRLVALTVVTKHLSIRFLDRIWQRLRATRGVKLVSQGRAAGGAGKALARGEVVAFMIDQTPERERATIVAPLLGRPARGDFAPAVIAMRARGRI